VADRIRLGDHEVEFGRLRNPITGIAGGCARGERSRPPAAELLEQVRSESNHWASVVLGFAAALMVTAGDVPGLAIKSK
jgi:hypothetical protein